MMKRNRVLPEPTSRLLLVRPHPNHTEGINGYLLRLSESNGVPYTELKRLGIEYELAVLTENKLLPDETVNQHINQTVKRNAHLLASSPKLWNHRYSRFCPLCLIEDPYWRLGWEILFFDGCIEHACWLIDQCSSCGGNLTWEREHLLRCVCGSDLRQEKVSGCPNSVLMLSTLLLEKILRPLDAATPTPFTELDITQTQRLIRFMGTYMDSESGRNPLKIHQVGKMSASWPITSLAAEVLLNWPEAFHQSIEKIESKSDVSRHRKIGDTFGRFYHYLYRGLLGAGFNPVRKSFEEWLSFSWRGGLAKRNSRVAKSLFEQTNWIPANIAMESLGISKQRLMYFIRQGVIEGEEHIGPSGRVSVMVRKDQLDLARAEVNGKIDMKAAGAMLGLSKSRMRQMLLMLFPDAKKLATAASVPWSISRESVENLLNISSGIATVSIPDEDCISVQHIFRYWAWKVTELVELIKAARDGELEILNLLDDGVGLNAWIFSQRDLTIWRAKTIQGYGNWLSINQVAILLNIRQQSAYQLVGKHFIHGDALHHQPKGGVRVKREEVERFKSTYIFCTEIGQMIGVSPKKAKSILERFYIKPVSGPGIDDARQLLYLRTDSLDVVLESIISKKDTRFSLI